MKNNAADSLSIENQHVCFSLRKDTGAYEIYHKPAQQVWAGPATYFCSLGILPQDSRSKSGYDKDFTAVKVNKLERAEIKADSVRFRYTVDGGYSTGKTSLILEFTVSLTSDTSDVVMQYRIVQNDPDWYLDSVDIVDQALTLDREGDYAVLPVQQGQLVQVGSIFSYFVKERIPSIRTSKVLGTYTGTGSWNMAMFGLVKDNSTVVLTWDHPSVEPGLCGREKTDNAQKESNFPWEIFKGADQEQVKASHHQPHQLRGREICSTVTLRRDAKRIRLHFIENGDYMKVAKYYRMIAQKNGYYLSFKQKLKRNPELVKNMGALRFTVAPKWGRSKEAGWAIFLKPGETRVDYTFDEIADVAEHLKHDLGIERALVLVKAISPRGYDMDYPDVLPAAQDCGGNAGLGRASERVQKLGWLFGVHDNSLILFKESPSSDGEDALVREDGSRVEGGIGIPRWRTYTCCPARMLKYAQKNYPRFKKLFHLNYIYSDCIVAAPLFECFSPKHPLTHQQTLAVYRELIEYKHSQVGIVGGEIADEWAVPLVDAMGISVGSEKDFGFAIPLFECVYRDCVNLEPWPWGMLGEREILNCVLMGRMPYLPYPQRNYLRDGLQIAKGDTYEVWWQRGYTPDNIFMRAEGGWAEGMNWYDRLVKNVYEVTSPLNELTMLSEITDHEYVTPDRSVERLSYSDGTAIVVNRGEAEFELAETMLPKSGFLAEGPTFITFHATRYRGIRYDGGALFTVRSLDGKTIAESGKIRIFHGFGENKVKVGKKVYHVDRQNIF